ncbi:hypothetical protein GCM10022224_082610 [Nonomuraea antimicrobica]|uniref:Secreted protein n=1 Tax=Nonomuraea antimicrobica TaxID=561173 RepID=A0ABP7DF75_9ACTN
MEWVRRSVAVMIAIGGAVAAYASQDWEWLLGVLAGNGVNVATNRTHEGCVTTSSPTCTASTKHSQAASRGTTSTIRYPARHVV